MLTRAAKPFERLTLYERRFLLIPATSIAILIELIIAFLAFNSPLLAYPRGVIAVAGGICVAYTWLLYRYLYPLMERYRWLHGSIVILNGLGLGVLSSLLPEVLGWWTDTLAVMVVFISAILSGRWLTYLFIFLFTFVHLWRVDALIPADLHDWMHLLVLPLIGVVVNETVLRLGDAINAKVRRLETINQLSRKLAASLEVERVISLVSATVREAIRADTYYVGLVQGDCVRLELFYDDGVFFPPQEIPAQGGLVGWVLGNRASLLIGNLPREVEKLGVTVRVIGQPKSSLSWIGTPMMAGDHLIGIMAMASYQGHAFHPSDLELVENMAQQAALVIDNAYHHAEIKRQSQMDSLTQVYNHGNLLAYLEEYSLHASQSRSPLSLIMLDVDFFKQYNDTYGHLVGDEALTQVVAAVRQNIRSSDILGRWGGEEFAVVLPDTHGRQAMQVAERIRQTLRTLAVIAPDGQRIQPPTVSQGIAMFCEVGEVIKLVDLADQRLYQAKERGRDQVEPDASYWETYTTSD